MNLLSQDNILANETKGTKVIGSYHVYYHSLRIDIILLQLLLVLVVGVIIVKTE